MYTKVWTHCHGVLMCWGLISVRKQIADALRTLCFSLSLFLCLSPPLGFFLFLFLYMVLTMKVNSTLTLYLLWFYWCVREILLLCPWLKGEYYSLHIIGLHCLCFASGFRLHYIQFHLLLTWITTEFYSICSLISTSKLQSILNTQHLTGKTVNLLIPLKNEFCTMC